MAVNLRFFLGEGVFNPFFRFNFLRTKLLLLVLFHYLTHLF